MSAHPTKVWAGHNRAPHAQTLAEAKLAKADRTSCPLSLVVGSGSWSPGPSVGSSVHTAIRLPQITARLHGQIDQSSYMVGISAGGAGGTRHTYWAPENLDVVSWIERVANE